MKINFGKKLMKSLCVTGFMGISSLWADIIPEGYESISYCAKIKNIPADRAIIAYVTGPMVQNYYAYEVNTENCLIRGYKFNSFSLYSIPKSLLDSAKYAEADIQETHSIQDASVAADAPESPAMDSDFSLMENSDISWRLYEPIEDHIEQISEEYSIYLQADGSLEAALSKRVTEYNDGSDAQEEVVGALGSSSWNNAPFQLNRHNEFITLSNTAQKSLNIQLLSMKGEVLFETRFSDTEMKIQLPAAGNYIAKISLAGQQWSFRLGQ